MKKDTYGTAKEQLTHTYSNMHRLMYKFSWWRETKLRKNGTRAWEEGRRGGKEGRKEGKKRNVTKKEIRSFTNALRSL
jgi:hypothetical protein